MIIRLAIYEFKIRYKPGRENIVADMLSRFFEEHEVNENPEDDYFDVLIAAIQHEPSQVRKTTAEDQDLDEKIKWIKDLILKNRHEKSKIIEFVNTNQRVFH